MDDFLAERERKMRQLFAQLAACPVVDLAGVVGPAGFGGARGGHEELWTLRLELDAWRIGSGAVRRDPIMVCRKMTYEELKRLRDAIHPDSIIRIRARVSEENVFGTPQALLEELVEREAVDEELQAALVELQKPVTHEDGAFGQFVLDRQVGWYTASVEWCGQIVELNVSVDEQGKLEPALQVARELWDQQLLWNERVREYAVQELFKLKNENWLDEAESEVSAEEFRNRMTLESVVVRCDGEFEFWHDDGDLFWGHAIQVDGHLSAGFTRAGISG